MPDAVATSTPVGEPAGVADARLHFTGRAQGNLSLHVGEGDAVAQRRWAIAAVGGDADAAVFMEQVHGAGVAVVDAAEAGRGLHDRADAVPGVDALVTFEPDLALVVLAADCVPVLLVDPGRGVAAIHAGRAGIAEGVIPAALEALAPPDPAAVSAFIGPAIGGCCYEVPAEMAAEVSAVVPEAAGRTRAGAPSLDLVAAARALLARAGVGAVARVGGCTRCTAGWFSHRGTGQEGWPAGRQAGIVLRTAESPASAAPRGLPGSGSSRS